MLENREQQEIRKIYNFMRFRKLTSERRAIILTTAFSLPCRARRSTVNDYTRRCFLKRLVTTLVQTAGTVVVASATASAARAEENKSKQTEVSKEDVQKRADRLAATAPPPPAENAESAVSFLNGRFRNSPWGGFRNLPLGGFRNTPLGAFRNTPFSGFRNTPFGTFGNGGWPNGGWGGFGNGWPNVGWRNW
jgi:hypothetical protein